MTSNFYGKTKSLFEDFKTRELYYLNVERNMKSSLHFSGSDCTSQVQDYLQKLNEREKQNEETYKKALYEVENLDRHADLISENLKKLTSLTASMVSVAPSWKLSNEYSDEKFSSSNSLSNNPQTFSHFKTPQIDSFHVLSSQIKSVSTSSTQTDLIFCEKCNFSLTSSLGTLDKFHGSTTQVEHSVTTKNNSDKNLSNIADNTSVSQSTNSKDASIDKEKLELTQVTEKPITHSTFIEQDEKRIPSLTNLRKNEQNDLIHNNTTPETGIVETTFPNENSFEAGDIVSTDESIDIVASKSDNESLNQEFDFLESDSKQEVLHKKFNFPEKERATLKDNLRKEIVSDNPNVLRNKNMIKDSVPIKNEDVPTRIKSDIKKTSGLLIGDDRKSELSLSIEGGHSPSLHSDNLSIISESDSTVEKESLNASAAYQALLGNISATKTIPKIEYSESESEDEIEKALAKAAKKDNISLATSMTNEKTQEVKKCESEIKPKPEPRKSISLGKPQQLSKNTRKVLGLDVSSGSEGEIQIQSKNNIDEDDEFFFD